MIKLKDLLNEQYWSSPSGFGVGGDRATARLRRLEARLKKKRAAAIAKLDRELNAEAKKELKGKTVGPVTFTDVRWAGEGPLGGQGVEVKYESEKE